MRLPRPRIPCSIPSLNVEATDLQSPHPCTRCVPICPPQHALPLRVVWHAGTRRRDLEGWRPLEREIRCVPSPDETDSCLVASDRAMMRTRHTPAMQDPNSVPKHFGVSGQNVPSNQSINQSGPDRVSAPLQRESASAMPWMPRP
jgi:hypothetical protein